MTPREVLGQVEGLGYRLALRPGGLWLSGAKDPSPEPPPDLLALICEHRGALLSLLAEDARRYAAHDASLNAGRLVPFPAHLVPLVHPSIRHLVEAQEPGRKRQGG